MLKVGLDAVILGEGFYQQKSKTGVYRVIENLSQQLMCHPDVQLHLASPAYLQDTLRHFQESDFGKELFFLHSEKDLNIAKWQNFLFKIFNDSSIPQKVVRRLVFSLLGNKSVLSSPKINEIAIYHSLFYSFPDEILNNKKLKKILTVHDIIPIIHPEFFGKNVSGMLQKTISAIPDDAFVACVSESTKSDFCNYSGIDESRVFVQYLAASPTIFYPENNVEKKRQVLLKYHIPVDQPYVLGLSTLEPRKNIQQLIRAFSHLVKTKKVDDLNLVLVGTKGWNYDDIFQQLADSGLQNRVFITGFVDDIDLSSIYSSAHCFVYLSHYEGFGLPVLEAMQCGVPVICSDNSSLPEVVGEAGILVNASDLEQIVQAIYNLYSDFIIYKAMKEKSLLRASHFSWFTFTNDTLQMYRGIL